MSFILIASICANAQGRIENKDSLNYSHESKVIDDSSMNQIIELYKQPIDIIKNDSILHAHCDYIFGNNYFSLMLDSFLFNGNDLHLVKNSTVWYDSRKYYMILQTGTVNIKRSGVYKAQSRLIYYLLYFYNWLNNICQYELSYSENDFEVPPAIYSKLNNSIFYDLQVTWDSTEVVEMQIINKELVKNQIEHLYHWCIAVKTEGVEFVKENCFNPLIDELYVWVK